MIRRHRYRRGRWLADTDWITVYPRLARSLLTKGSVDTRAGHRVRLVAFGTSTNAPVPYLQVMLRDVVAYVDRFISENWEVVRGAGSKDPIFGVMLLLAKACAGRQ